MKNLGWAIYLVIVLGAEPSYAIVQAKFSRIGDVTHIEFSGQKSWSYSLNSKENKIVLDVPKLSDKSIVAIKTWKDPFVKSIDVEEGNNLGHRLTFHLSNNQIDVFDYLTDQPNRLIVDIFKSEVERATPPSPVANKGTNKKSNAKRKKGKVTKSKREDVIVGNVEIERNPAGEIPIEIENPKLAANIETDKKGLFDGSDPNFERFNIKEYNLSEESQILSRQNIYLTFPPLIIDHGYFDSLINNPPEYEVLPKNNRENKVVRLLLTLFKSKRFAIFNKTLDLFRKEFPKSRYEELIGYLQADVEFTKWIDTKKISHLEKALGMYGQLIIDYPESKLSERTNLLIGYAYSEQHQYLKVISTFDGFLRRFPNSIYVYQVQMGIADTFRKIKRFETARAKFKELSENELAGKFQKEAAYRLGDTFFHEEKKYGNAIQYYSNALNKFPEEGDNFPSAYFNLSEAYFWREEYIKSLKHFNLFLKKFPSHPYGGYALTRIGELLEILGADKKKVLGAYLESIFRYRASPGSKVARIRLISQRMPQMKQKEVDRGIEEALGYAKETELKGIKDFTNLLISDGLLFRKDFNRAKELLVNYYKDNIDSPHLELFKKRIVDVVTNQIQSDIDSNRPISALRVYGKNKNSWLKGADRLDVEYYIGKSFEKTGTPIEALKRYRKILNKLYSIKGTREEKIRKVFEKLPTIESLNLRIAKNYLTVNEFPETLNYLDRADEKGLNENEKIEREELYADLFESTGRYDRAIITLENLVNNWKGKPELVARPTLRLASSLRRKKRYSESLKLIDSLLYLSKHSKDISKDTVIRSYLDKAKTLEAMKKNDEAISSYRMALKISDNPLSYARDRYRLGELLFKKGHIKEAETEWAPLNKPETSVWYKLAQEKLTDIKWSDQYRKYIKRIPAMSGFEKR